MFLEVEEGGQDPDEEAVKVYLIRFIADLPLSCVTCNNNYYNHQLLQTGFLRVCILKRTLPHYLYH